MAKKIVFYCGIDVNNNGVYVRNGKDYLSMHNRERMDVLSRLIAELNHELNFVVKQVTAETKTALVDQGLPQ
jgi:hypothetical protein